MKKHILFILSALPLTLTSCIGYNLPHFIEMKPYTYFRGGDQLGRDQLANRMLVANAKVVIKGKNSNEVLSLLGQPQDIQVRERNVSEDWYFIYYKRYKTWLKTDQGLFYVRFQQGEAVDAVKVN